MKKIIIITLAIVTLLSVVSPVYANETIIDSGSCGVNLTWVIDANGLLTISGLGEMDNYSLKSTPWESYRNSIKSIKIGNNVTTISDCAFDSFIELETILLPNTITYIGNGSFDKCSKLINLTIPNEVTTIGNATFKECKSLSKIIIPDSVTSMGTRTFEGCTNLTEVYLSNNLTEIGKWTFQDCTSLKNITISSNIETIDWYAFKNCPNLKTVLYSGSKNLWNKISIENYNDSLTDAKIIYNYNGEKTISAVEKNNNSYKVNVDLYNIDEECEIIVAGYKDKEFITLQNVKYSKDNEEFTLTGDIDEIKVMLWNNLGKLKPYYVPEIITEDKWL